MRNNTDPLHPSDELDTFRMSMCPFILGVTLCLLTWTGSAPAVDCPVWGQAYSRNMISNETGLADRFDPATGQNVKWIAPLGTQTYATPIVAAGKVFIGTNNERPRDPDHQGDRGVLLCLNESDGSLCWQLIATKLSDEIYKDWPKAGMCSPPTVEGDRVYMVTNRGEIMCLDIEGQANGNEGPFLDEARHRTPPDKTPVKLKKTDADILWSYDIPKEMGLFPHDSAHCSIMIDGPFLYVNTNSGLKGTHAELRMPEAPCLIVLEKSTGRLLAQERSGIGPGVFHSTWSSPGMARINGKRRVFFAGGNGVVYAFEPMREVPPTGTVATLKEVWRFDCDPTAPKENIHEYIRNREVSPSNIKSTAVFYKNRIYVTYGGDIWWGKEQAWLKCFDATGTGDITSKAERWCYPVERHCCSTPSIWNGLVFVADCGRNIHCVDAETGEPYWTQQCAGDVWASTLVADGKVYLGTRRRDFWIMAAEKDKKVLCSVKLDGGIVGSAIAANGVVYIPTMKSLYAIHKSDL